jgi:predicted glycogen debranching enzyme
MNYQKTNTYLKFDKSRMVNLEYSLNREILRTNRRGAYHCTTLVECNTRKQHGLLVVPVPRLGNSNHVLLSSFDETVIQHGADFNLGIHKYDGSSYSPMGHKYIREFSCDSLPRTIYRVGGVVLSKEKMFSLKYNTIYIRYTLLDAHSPTTMRFKPFLAFREINRLTGENTVANHGYKEVDNGISMCMYTGYPELFMQFNKEVKFIFDPHWYKGIEYQKDMEDGLPYKEDLYVPGYFELPIAKGESVIFSASDVLSEDTAKLPALFEEGIMNRTPRSSFYNCLKNSGHQFYFQPSESELYLLNGYPWGEVRAREQFMALNGLTLGIGKEDAFENIVDTAITAIEQLMDSLPVTSDFLKDIGDADVLLWLIWSLKRYSAQNNERFYVKYASLVSRMVAFIQDGKHPNLKPLANGLLAVEGKYPSWMHSASSDHIYAVPRTGCLVEVNAFWYNALMFNREIAKHTGDSVLEKKMAIWAEATKASFLGTFLNDSGYLYDCVKDNYVDWSVRPNMLLAISIDYPILDRRQSKSVLDIVTKELLTAKGIRSLSPKSMGFHPRCEGSLYDKIHSSCNGAVWPWLLSAYMEAYMKVFQRSGYSFMDKLLIGVEEEMSNDCIGSLSAVYDGSIPYFGHGPISYAINVAGVISALNMQKAFADEY